MSNWIITVEDRCKSDERFQFLKPINGFITGEQARAFFSQSKLSIPILAQIWSLADLTSDGKLDKREFSIAMLLIKRCLEGYPLPQTLPPTLLQDAQPFNNSIAVNNNGGPLITSPDVSNNVSIDSNEWSIPLASRPRYRLQFNQNDRNKRGYLTGVEARGIFIKSNLPQLTLANIWNFADVDKDGNLTCDEFCIAAYLIDQVLAGRKLPSSLPPSLLPSQYQSLEINNLSEAHKFDTDQKLQAQQTFEDKRMQNFLLGQAELEKRKHDLEDQLQRDEESRREKFRIQIEKEAKIKEEIDKERQKQMELEFERQKVQESQREARRKQITSARLQTLREVQRQKAIEIENTRIEALLKEKNKQMTLLEQTKAHRASLLEAAGGQIERRQEVEKKYTLAQTEVETQKQTISEMRNQRDSYEREIRDLNERTEAAKAELHRWQREQEQLALRLSTDVNQTSEQQKTLSNNLQQRDSNVQRLKAQLSELDSGITQSGKQLASHRHKAEDLTKNYTQLTTELRALRATLMERFQALQLKKSVALSSNAATAFDISSWPGGPSEWCVAVYAYTAAYADELSFQIDDRIQVFTNPPFPVGEGWLFGEFNSKRGILPASYVKKEVLPDTSTTDVTQSFTTVVSTQKLSSPTHEHSTVANGSIPYEIEKNASTCYCVALYNFESNMTGDLNLIKGDKVQIIVQKDDWFEGISMRTNSRGLFPSNYVRIITADHPPPSSAKTDNSTIDVDVATKKSSDSVHDTVVTLSEVKDRTDSAPVITVSETPELAVVLTPFTSLSAEQINLTPGQYVKIRKRSSKGWWEGEMQQRGQGRQIGWFPAEYVKVVSSTNNPTDSMPEHYLSNQTSTEDKIQTEVKTDIVHQKSTKHPHLPTVTQSHSKIDLSTCKLVQAQFSYTSCQSDELTFAEGDLIYVISHEEEGWWKGRLKSTGAEGLFPLNYVKPCTTSGPKKSSSSNLFSLTTEDEMVRSNTIDELIATEQIYSSDLQTVNKICISLNRSHMLTDKEMLQIFGNWSILTERSLAFSKELNDRKASSKGGIVTNVGDIILRHLPKCVVYRDFCANQEAGLEILNQIMTNRMDVRDFISKCSEQLSASNMLLSSYFIKPVQRIARYKLLIQKIAKHTASSHSDFADISQAYDFALSVLTSVNEAVRGHENEQQLKWLQSRLVFTNQSPEIVLLSTVGVYGTRRLINSGTLYKMKSKKGLVAFLFNDMLCLTVPSHFPNKEPFTLPKKPPLNMKITFKVSRKPILLSGLRAFSTNQRIRRQLTNKSVSLADLSSHVRPNSVNSVEIHSASSSKTITEKQENNSDEEAESMNAIFSLSHDTDPLLKLNLKAPSEKEKYSWISAINAASQACKIAEEKTRLRLSRSDLDKNIMFVAVVTVTIVCADDLKLVGVSEEELPRPFCEVSVCLRSKRSNVILDTRSPKWNCCLKFAVMDIAREVVTIIVYSKPANSRDEFLGRAEVPLQLVADHCLPSNQSWQSTFPLLDVPIGSVTAKFELVYHEDGINEDNLDSSCLLPHMRLQNI